MSPNPLTAVSTKPGEVQYSYSGGQLVSITDPAGLTTALTYTDGRLASVRDPAARTTTFGYDAANNLIGVAFPDGSTRSFGYDSQHLMTSETDPRGSTVRREFDNAGRLRRATLADGTVVSTQNAQTVGLVDPGSGLGSPSNPAPVVRPADALSRFTDGNSNQQSIDVRGFGAARRVTDALTRTTVIDRDASGNPIRVVRPDGAAVVSTYDALGNLLTRTEQSIGATTAFTYEPTFNQIASIRDAKGGLTTISYDASGNPVAIVDALARQTQVTYIPGGLPATITAAVGRPEQSTSAFTYDARGRVLTSTDPLGRTSGLPPVW